MARLLIQTRGFANPALELRLGVNRVGRNDQNDFAISHPSISSEHCEFIFSSEGVVLHDLNSTNGSFVNGQPVSEIWLEAGQRVRLGEVELLVESTEINVSIPQFERVEPVTPSAPLVLPDGSFVCPRHPDLLATFKCTHCFEVMCSGCVRMMRRQGGQPLFLCTRCHSKCERIISDQIKSKKGFFGFLQDTVRLKFGGRPKD
jgi:pSer/pThr/pTyr-binding forkhead associated (FHA) protein